MPQRELAKKGINCIILAPHKQERYAEIVKKLICIKGITPHTALSFTTEVCDFNRFESAEKFASYIGLTTGEQSSGDSEHKTNITKAENRHLRRLAVEVAWTYMRGNIGQKSVELKKDKKICLPM